MRIRIGRFLCGGCLLMLLSAAPSACTIPSEGRAAVPPEVHAKPALSEETLNADLPVAMETLNVRVMALEIGELTESAMAHGETQAEHRVLYSAETQGRIEFLDADLGEPVKPGQVLARVDFQLLRAQTVQAENNAQLAQRTYERLSQLREQDLVSPQQYDEARATMVSAQVQMDIARRQLNRSVIRASLPGVVTERHVQVGEFVHPGTPLLEVMDYRTLIVEGRVSESEVAHIRADTPVDVEIASLERTVAGALETILPTADPVSRTFRARVRVPNPELTILVGMSARLRFLARTFSDVLIVPQNAVVEEVGGVRSVFVLNGDRAEKRRVTLGAHQGSRVILREGVAPGEQLIIMGQRDVQDGQPVRVLP